MCIRAVARPCINTNTVSIALSERKAVENKERDLDRNVRHYIMKARP